MVFLAKLTPSRCILTGFILLGVLFIFVSAILREISDTAVNPPHGNRRDATPPFPGRELDKLHWFVQVSDVHVSLFYDKQRGPDLKAFIQDYILQMIKPEVVLVTGDLTDAKYPDKMGSSQFEDEWKIYRKILDDTGVMNKTVWLDIRGNHDVFSVPSEDSPQNFYRKYSAQGRDHPSHYMYKHRAKDGDTYSFIAVDSCPIPGPRRPFNFFGHLKQDDMDTLRRYRAEAVGSNKTFWFGHYPSSTVYAPEPGFRSLIGQDIHLFGYLHQLGGLVTDIKLMTSEGNLELEIADWMGARIEGGIYMAGHLHTLLDYATAMHARMQQDFLQIEVGDWKDYRRFRVFAVDHDLFSFTDETYQQFPVVLITNPKNAYFNQPIEEPTGRMLRSTHIRMLIFTPGELLHASVSIDGVLLGEAEHSQGPLYVLPWKPDLYQHGVHTIAVTVLDNQGNERTIKQPFSLDNTKLAFDWWPRYLLMFDHIFFCKCMFAGALLSALIPLLTLRFLSIQVQATYSGQSCPGCVSRWVQTWLRRLFLLSHNNTLFYGLLGYLLYVCLGPWFIGEVMEGHIGAVFVHGIYVYGTFIPGTLTYMYGFFQIVTFNIPLMLYLARVLDQSISQHKHSATTTAETQQIYTRSQLCFLWLYNNGCFLILMFFQFNMAYFGICKAYGLMAFVLGPVRTWSIPFAIYLRYVAMHHGSVVNRDTHQAVPVLHEQMANLSDNMRSFDRPHNG